MKMPESFSASGRIGSLILLRMYRQIGLLARRLRQVAGY